MFGNPDCDFEVPRCSAKQHRGYSNLERLRNVRITAVENASFFLKFEARISRIRSDSDIPCS
jgi:hypothetical protein